jgi:deoxycytidine triphosphate deaminase
MDQSLILSDTEIAAFSSPSPESGRKPLIDPCVADRINSGTYLLTIGGVYTPLTPGEQGTRENARGMTLEPGMMAIVVSHERLSVPPDLLGIVFGMNRLTREGLMLVNPGVITTGHTREVSLTVINFGRKPVDLLKGGAIARVFFLLTDSGNAKNPGNSETDTYRNAINYARQALHPSFSGHLKEFLDKPYRELVTGLWINVGLGVVGFGLMLSLVATLSPIIAERALRVPTLERRLDSLQVQLTQHDQRLRLLGDSAAAKGTMPAQATGTNAARPLEEKDSTK